MKTSVRFLSLLLAVLMIAGVAFTASAEKTEKIANDEALEFLVKLGVFGGYEDGSLKPDNKVERDEMAKIIFTLSTTFTDAGAGTASFADVPANDWSAGYISWCSTKGIVGGYGNGNFGPNDYVTYDQALKMVAGAMGYNEWDSNLWPTDVRMVALTKLSLGDNLESVKGSDFVTRAQIAQIVYNALDKDMNQTKSGPYGTKLPMTLKADVWGVSEVADKIVATENFYLTGSTATEEEDVISLNVYGEATLEELGLDAYFGKTDDIIGAEVSIIYRGEDILGTTIKSIYSDEVELTKDKENKLYVNGVVVNEENPVNERVIDDNGLVSDTAYDTLPNKDYAYDAKTVDFNADGKVDVLEINYYLAATVKSVGKKSVIFDNLTNGIDADITVENEFLTSSVVLAEDDVVVLKVTGPKVEVVEVIKPVTASVTKFGNNKITISGNEYAVNKDVFVNLIPTALDSTVMDKDSKDEAKKYDFYIYNGKVFYAVSSTPEVGAMNFAVLAYVNKPEEPVLNAETQTFSEAYTAVLVIDGKETVVPLNAEETIIDENGQTISIADEYQAYLAYLKDKNDAEKKPEDKAPADKIFVPYSKAERIIDGYLQAPYTLVSYVIDEDGKYTLSIKDEGNADYKILEPGTKITYNKDFKFFNIAGDSKVIMNDASAIYYTYTKMETGDHKYLGIYTKADIKNEFEEAETVGYSYLYKGENDDFYTIAAIMLKEELVEIINEADYKTDARLIKYCYGDSTSEMIVERDNGIFYTHNLMDMSTLKNESFAYTDKTIDDGAVALEAGYFYAFDKDLDEYVKITMESAAELGVTSVSSAKLSDVYNGLLFTDSGDYVSGVRIPESAVIWMFNVSANGDKGTIGEYGYKQVTLDDLAATLELAREKAEIASEKTGEPVKYDMRLIFFTYEDGKGKEQIAYVLAEYYSEHSNGSFFIHNSSIFNKFGA